MTGTGTGKGKGKGSFVGNQFVSFSLTKGL